MQEFISWLDEGVIADAVNEAVLPLRWLGQ